MNIEIKVIVGAKRNMIKKDKSAFKVYLTALALEGRANKALIEFLSRHFEVKRNQIKIIKGLKSRYKTISILS